MVDMVDEKVEVQVVIWKTRPMVVTWWSRNAEAGGDSWMVVVWWSCSQPA